MLARCEGPVLVVTGDAPLMQADSVAALLADYRRRPAACVLGTAYKDDPDGLGRILRDAAGEFHRHHRTTRRHARTAADHRNQHELLRVRRPRSCSTVLDQIRPNNRQGEYYITDAPGLLAAQGKEVRALPVLQPCEALGINTVDELAVVEAELRRMQ